MLRRILLFVLPIILFCSTTKCLSQDGFSKPQLVLDAKEFNEPVAQLALSNDGKFLAAASHKVVRIWDIEDQSYVATLRGYQGEDGYVVGSVNPPRLAAPSRRTNQLLLRHKNLIYAQEPSFLLVASRKRN